MEVFLYIVVGFMLAFHGLYSGTTLNDGATVDAPSVPADDDSASEVWRPCQEA